MEEKILQDLTEYLFKQESKKLVGKVCKRFETFSPDKKTFTTEEVNIIKENVKEILYEWLRDFRDQVVQGKVIFKLINEQK